MRTAWVLIFWVHLSGGHGYGEVQADSLADCEGKYLLLLRELRRDRRLRMTDDYFITWGCFPEETD